MSNLKDVLELWQSNLQFRSEFKKNPQEALKKAQIELSTTDLEKIQAIIERNGFESDDLDKRINK